MELRDIDGFPGYKVSDDGRVWAEKRQKWLKGVLRGNGYLQVNLYVGGKPYTKTIHRLVAEAFLPNPDNLSEVNHRDEDKTNNSVGNLEWLDHKSNINYGSHNERCHTPEAHAKMKTTQQRIYGKPVVQLTLDGEEIARYCCAMEAARQTGFDHGNICQVCRGKYKTFKGFRWKYLSKEGE